ncbi:MAG: T9SS type A sorting domain-containing protein, partial [Bacteroidota bacterium]|nr:T9SS type A sorting domain-containing protein [Bacteroidota bacterium]
EIGFDSEDGVEYFLRFDGFLWENNGITWTANGAFCLQAFPGNVNGIDELEPVSLTAFPNPSVGGSVSLSWPGIESVADVAVFDLTGRQVAGLTQVVRNEMVNLNLPQGTYVVKMRTETSSATTQLQVVR